MHGLKSSLTQRWTSCVIFQFIPSGLFDERDRFQRLLNLLIEARIYKKKFKSDRFNLNKPAIKATLVVTASQLILLLIIVYHLNAQNCLQNGLRNLGPGTSLETRLS